MCSTSSLRSAQLSSSSTSAVRSHLKKPAVAVLASVCSPNWSGASTHAISTCREPWRRQPPGWTHKLATGRALAAWVALVCLETHVLVHQLGVVQRLEEVRQPGQKV